MDTPDTLVIRSRSEAELLASLPAIAGMPLDNSVVVVPFWGKRTPSAMRIDLPPAGSPQRDRSVASSFLGHLARLSGCDGVAMAIFTDEPYARALPDRRDLLTHLIDRFHASGFEIVDAWIVAADGWGSFFDSDHEAGPRPLTDIEDAHRQLPVPRAPHALPETDPALAARVAAQLAARLVIDSDLDSFGQPRSSDLPDPIEFLERALTQDPANAGPQTLARVIALLDSEGAVDRTVLQIAFGRAAGATSWQDTLKVRRMAAQSGRTPMDVLLDSERNGSMQPSAMTTAKMLTGQCVEIPSPERLHAGAVLLGRTIAHCPPSERAWVMCALAWVRWALGITSAAEQLLRSAAKIAPSHSLVPIYYTIVTHFLPEWIFERVAEIAAGPNRAARRRSR